MAFKTIYYSAKQSVLIFLYIVAHNCMFDYVILQMKLLKNNFYPSNVFDLFEVIKYTVKNQSWDQQKT